MTFYLCCSYAKFLESFTYQHVQSKTQYCFLCQGKTNLTELKFQGSTYSIVCINKNYNIGKKRGEKVQKHLSAYVSTVVILVIMNLLYLSIQMNLLAHCTFY